MLKHTYGKIDIEASNYSLNYLRTKDGEEVDFALIKEGEIEQIIEAKLSDKNISKPLINFQKKYNHKAIQLVKNLRHEYKSLNTLNIVVRDAEKFLVKLFL